MNGYGFYHFVGDTSREDDYSNIYIKGSGGAYLVSAPQFFRDHGYVLLSKHPDPSPETEASMEALTGLTDSQRTKVPCTINVFSNPTIDEVAQAIYDHDYVGIGITWTDEGFAKSWTNPTYSPSFSGADGHALWCVNPITTPAGLHAIDCQSSWTGERGPDGVSVHHEIDSNFFAAGGCFELITVDIIKNKEMQLIKTPDGTVYMETAAGITGIADQASLAALFGGEPIVSVAALPSPELYTISQGFVINRK